MNSENISAKIAARICGFESVAMLDYLQRSEVFIPSDLKRRPKVRGKRRMYSFRDLVVLKTIATLLKNGATVKALKIALQDFQAAKWNADRASMQFDGAVARYLIASGDKILFAKSSDSVFDLTDKGQMVFSFIIDLDKVHSEVRFALDQKILPMA